MIGDDLIESGQIDPFEFKIYKLFNTELGQEVLKECKDRAFFEAPQPASEEFTDLMLGYCEGRRSVIREHYLTIEKINNIIKENNYV